MYLPRKVKTLLRVFKQDGIRGIVSRLISKLDFPIGLLFPRLIAKCKWEAGISSEAGFWDDYFRTKGLQWADSYAAKFDPDLPLQPRVVALLPPHTQVHILDVGAGPLTHLGKVCAGKQIDITAVDPLASEYDRILDKYKIQPLVRTQPLDAEHLSPKFHSNSFDLAYARNCMDHSYDPEKAILQMIDVVKKDGYVLLEHLPNEAITENYAGLHQWNFSMSPDGDFLISSKNAIVNMTKKYAELCTITCEMVYEGEADWLVARILKKR